jgi:hypothetical protein
MEEADEATVMKRRWKFFDVGGRGRWKRQMEEADGRGMSMKSHGAHEGRGMPKQEGRCVVRMK